MKGITKTYRYLESDNSLKWYCKGYLRKRQWLSIETLKKGRSGTNFTRTWSNSQVNIIINRWYSSIQHFKMPNPCCIFESRSSIACYVHLTRVRQLPWIMKYTGVQLSMNSLHDGLVWPWSTYRRRCIRRILPPVFMLLH